MQTIRIYSRKGGLVQTRTGITGKVETPELRAQYPESEFYWLR